VGFFQTQENDTDAANHFHLFPVSPTLCGGIGQGMWNQSQPFRILVKLAPAANITCMGEEEVDRTIEFVCPFSTMRDGAALSID
jgi:hypothetical protein